MTLAPAYAPIAAAFPVVQAWLRADKSAVPPATLADKLAKDFDLDEFGRNLLLTLAYAALEPQAAEDIARAQREPLATQITLGLALALLPGANWTAVATDSLLRRTRLIQLDAGTGLTGAQVRLAETVLFALLDAPCIADGLVGLVRPLRAVADLAPNRARLAAEIGRQLALPGRAILHLSGTDPAGKLEAFGTAAVKSGHAGYVLNSALLPATAPEIIGLAAQIERDLALVGGLLVIDHGDVAEARPTQLFCEVFASRITLASQDPMHTGHRMSHRLDMPQMSASEQLPVWRDGLGTALSEKLNGSLGLLAATFRVSPEVSRSVGAEMAGLDLQQDETRSPGRDKGPDFAKLTWDACRRAARPRMDDLARRVEGIAGWNDLILPQRQKETLRAIVAQVRNRAKVYEEWGFGSRLQNRGLGISAMFSGPSGAGKTLAAEVIGTELGLDVYRVDLSALVSKWVGETEKNLRRVFDAAEDGGVILLFDEADALFGKRSEVRDSHDRHANIEVSYLLQRLEAYRGLCVLTTNLRDNIDDAFMRRIRFVIDFRFPALAEREAIWQRVFPKGAPIEQLDFATLGRLNVSGGSIRNIALGATFLAAEGKVGVTMPLIYRAVLQEYEKTGRIMTDAERSGWPQ